MKQFAFNLIILLSIIFCLLCCISCKTTYSQKINIDKTNIPVSTYEDKDFIRVDGTKLVCADGSDFFIKGMAFGNTVWGNVNTEPRFHHTKESYKELKEMGFNSVRFYINYQLFESDAKPYVYRKNGFEWLNKNIQWAKENGIYLIVNMHVPQGGFQSNGDGRALFKNPENQNRLIELWKVIADYYKDCSTILGWGLVNEPVVQYVQNDEKESLKTWHSLAQRITEAIRSVDKNHILFVEKAISIMDDNHNYFSFEEKDSYPIIQDENLVYEFHSYDPIQFTHQQASWIPQLKETIKYPDDTKYIIESPHWQKQNTVQFRKLADFPAEWTEFSYTFSANDEDFSKTNVFNASIKPGFIDKGELLIDDIIITETDKNGNSRILKEYDFNEDTNLYFGTNPEIPDGKSFWTNSDGHNKKGCYKIIQTKSWAYLTAPDYFILKKDCTYTISVWAKTKNLNKQTCYAEFGFDLSHSQKASTFTKDYIQQVILNHIKTIEDLGKPIFVGEFGCIRNCFEGNGGLEYVKDSLEVFRNYTAGFSYHTYHEWNFGLHYTNPDTELPNSKEENTELKEFFTELLPSF